MFSGMIARDCSFALDIGTRHNDLLPRMETAKECLDLMDDTASRDKARRMLFFSAGIWPDEEAIKNRSGRVACLGQQIALARSGTSLFPGNLIAVGECGLDHHWNAAGADKRSGEGWDDALFRGESEMFMMQLELARTLSLPVIVHSRDAFDDTLSCIDEVAYNRGIIHCYSYGIAEARQFLDRGWHIALGGAVTYTKKRLMEEMRQLIRFIPDDRLLLETDAPYLAPVPCRGQVPAHQPHLRVHRGCPRGGRREPVPDGRRELPGTIRHGGIAGGRGRYPCLIFDVDIRKLMCYNIPIIFLGVVV